MPTGSIQRGFSRGGQKPTKEGKKPPKEKSCSSDVSGAQPVLTEKSAQDKLDRLQAQYPELYGYAKRAAERVEIGAEGKVVWTVTFIENVIKRVAQQRSEEQLLAGNKRRRESAELHSK